MRPTEEMAEAGRQLAAENAWLQEQCRNLARLATGLQLALLATHREADFAVTVVPEEPPEGSPALEAG